MFSLIVATLDRTRELERLLASLQRQSYRNFEVIVVDQNPDDRLVQVINRHQGLTIAHLRSKRGLSRARNVGLRRVKGEFIGFPDDDAWYPPELLARVKRDFDLHPEFGVVFAMLRDADDQAVGPKWPDHGRLWTKQDVWKYGISPAGFLRREVADAIGPFNDHIGIGAATPYQSGEDVDYFVRPLSLGWKIWYDPALTVHHPSFHRLERLRERSYSYALGGGYTLRAHNYSPGILLNMLVRSIGGTVFFFCRGNPRVAKMYLLRAAGLIYGYLFGPSDLRKITSIAD